MKLNFKTKLSIAECKERIANNADKRSFYTYLLNGFYSKKGIEYYFNGSEFELKKIRPNYRNTLPRTFYGEFNKTSYGTEITVESHMSIFGMIFLVVWETLVIIISILVLISMYNKGTLFNVKDIGDLMSFVIPILLPFAGVAIFYDGKRIANKDTQIIKKLIEDHCNAEPEYKSVENLNKAVGDNN